MSLSKEVSETIIYLREVLRGDVYKKFEFDGKNGPIIGIHGVFGGWVDAGIKTYMKSRGVCGSLVYFGSLTRGLDYYLPSVDEEIKKHPNALILGYSGGGLLALRFAQKYGWDGFGKIITIETPFNGIPRFYGFLGKTLRELQTRSQVLIEILALKPPPNKVLSLFALEDYFTPNPKELKLNWPTVVLGARSHGDLQNHKEWIAQILDAELGIS